MPMVIAFTLLSALSYADHSVAQDNDPRVTPLVRAVRHCQESVVKHSHGKDESPGSRVPLLHPEEP